MRIQARARSRAAWPALVALVLGAPACEGLPAAPDTNLAPTATFFFTPVSPVYAGQSPVAFNASGSYDEDGAIVSYTWDFGDGSDPRTVDSPSISHTFPDTEARCLEITYGVSLTVTDDAGMSSLVSDRVTVTELPAPTAPECRQ